MRVKLEKMGVLGAGQVKKGGSLPRHIPMLNIYVSTPPPPPPPGHIIYLYILLVSEKVLGLIHWGGGGGGL